MSDIVVYNLEPSQYSASSDQASVYTDATATSPAASDTGTASSAAPSGSPASPITEGDVRNLIKSELSRFNGDFRVGALLSGQVFILDSRGLMMGSTEFSTAPFSVTYDGLVTASNITLTGGTIRFGKTSFTDSTNAGYYISSEGAYFGAASDASKLKYKVSDGTFDFIGTISSRSTVTIASSIDASGNLLTDITNARLDTSAKKMLSGFTFGTADYAGALNSGTITWNTTTGALTGGSGVLVYRGGIIGAASGVATFTIDASTGAATFAGALSAPTGTIGGFTIGATDLSATSGGNTTILSSGSTAFSAGPTGAPTVTITQAGAMTVSNLTATSPSGINIVGSISCASQFTAGQAIYSGNNVSVDTATGNIYRTRVTAFGSINTPTTESLTTSSQDPSAGAPSTMRFVDVSSTVKLLVLSETSGLVVLRIVVDPTTSAITSITETTVTGSSSGRTNVDVVKLSSTAVCLVYVAGGNVYARILSGLDSGVTANTEKNCVAAGTTSAAAAYVSSTELIIFYYVAATEVRAMQLTISGTTISTGSTSTVYANATDQNINCAIQFGTSNAYLICMSQSTTNFRGIVGTYSGGTMTMGSVVAIEAYHAIGCAVASSDDTHVLVAYGRGTSDNARVRCMSRSGTTLTANTAYATSANAISTANLGFNALGKYTFALGYVGNTSTNFAMDLLELVGTTVSQLGTTLSTFSAHAGEDVPYPVYHSPTRLIVAECYGSTVDVETIDLTNNHSTWIGIANADIASAATGYVVTHGTSPTVSSTLATGSIYYTDIDGAHSTVSTGQRVGVAVSTTKLVTRS